MKWWLNIYIASLGKGVATSPHSNQKEKNCIIYKLCFKKWFFQIMGLAHFDHLSINNLEF
jgi:hypothetical protein